MEAFLIGFSTVLCIEGVVRLATPFLAALVAFTLIT